LLNQAQHGDPVALAAAGIGVAQRVRAAGAVQVADLVGEW
jgi:hypothetical protein